MQTFTGKKFFYAGEKQQLDGSMKKEFKMTYKYIKYLRYKELEEIETEINVIKYRLKEQMATDGYIDELDASHLEYLLNQYYKLLAKI